jgi:hypothetical protein
MQMQLAVALFTERVAAAQHLEERLVEIREDVAGAVDFGQAEELGQLRDQMLDERGAGGLGPGSPKASSSASCSRSQPEVRLQLHERRHLEDAEAPVTHAHDARRGLVAARRQVPVEGVAVLVDDQAPARRHPRLRHAPVELGRQMIRGQVHVADEDQEAGSGLAPHRPDEALGDARIP